MIKRLATLLFLLYPAGSFAAVTVSGEILDPSGAPIPGAQVAAVGAVGVLSQSTTNQLGRFELTIGVSIGEHKLVVTAPGFETKTVPSGSSPITVRLALAPQVDSIRVVGSAMDVPLSEQGGSVSIIPHEEIRQRNEASAIDLLRYVPGLVVNQVGQRGGFTSLFIRGGESNFSLVQIDGVTVNFFGLGGFDFAHIPTDFLERIEVIRGPQSAVYGAYANSGVVNFVTRQPQESANLDLIAEGGSHRERRFAIGSGAMVKGFGIAASVSRLDTDGPVQNSDYRNENLFLSLSRSFNRQNIAARGHFNSNEAGVPGPYGSDPAHTYGGLDLVSRNKNNFSDYQVHYQIDLNSRARQELFGSFFLNNGFFGSPFGDSYSQDLRASAETRTILSLSRHDTVALGYAASRERMKNTFAVDNNSHEFPLHRDQHGIYLENRFEFKNRLFVNAGGRLELIRTPRIPADTASGRPELDSQTITKLNPKIAAAYLLRGTRIHSSFGTGIRPASGLEMAFTNNPVLKPERTRSFDIGVEQRVLRGIISLDATYFYNRYYDLIVSLGGDLVRLSAYRNDNLANSRSQGVEFAARMRPTRWISIAGNYTYLRSEVLALSGTSSLAPRFFRVGQELIRRPAHSGAVSSTFVYRKLSANITGYLRGTVLDVEPTFGAFAGLYNNPGYATLGINLNYALGRGVVAYGSVRNVLNQYYEEAFGFPSPKLNFVSGIKWNLHGKGI